MQRWIAAAIYPDGLPAWRRLLIFADSSLRAQDHDRPDADSINWSVFRADGTWLPDVRVPARLRIMDIGRDNIVGVWRDELEVETVRIYRLAHSSRN